MANKQNIKSIIKKKIEITKTGNKILIGKTHIDNNKEKKLRKDQPKQIKSNPIMNKRMEQRAGINKPATVSKNIKPIIGPDASRVSKRSGVLEKKVTGDIPVVLKDYGVYVRENNVDYDVVICVTSFERYDKIRRILKQLHTQESKYTFKFILMNDASTDSRYDQLINEFPDIIYLKNEVNGGKENYWRTVNKLWSVGKTFKCHGFLQIDDDFILCNNFLDILMDEFFRKKEEDNCNMVFSYHMYGYDPNKPLADWWYSGISIAIDGGTLFDNRFLKFINHYIDIGEKIIGSHTSTFFWDTIVQHIREFGVKVYRMPKSLAWHDGNFDSKLNYIARKSKKSYTKNFIDGDDKYPIDRDLIYVTFG